MILLSGRQTRDYVLDEGRYVLIDILCFIVYVFNIVLFSFDHTLFSMASLLTSNYVYYIPRSSVSPYSRIVGTAALTPSILNEIVGQAQSSRERFVSTLAKGCQNRCRP